MKIITTFLLFICIVTNSNAQLLWKISGNGLSKPSYVMGTHHLAPLSIKDNIAGLVPAFESTAQVVGELKMSDIQSPVVMQTMQKMMVTETDTTFKSLFTPEEYEMINQYTKENLKLDIAMMPKLKPAFIQNNLIVLLYMKKIGNFNPQEQLDTYFQTEAIKKGKNVLGLETPDFQFGLLYNGSSLQRQAELLLCMLNNLDKTMDQTKNLTDKYMQQDLEALHKISLEREGNNCDPLPGEMEALVDSRNKVWAEKLPALMNSAPAFIVVGALHLPGNNGLLNLLKKKGYSVEAVK